ncbi:uncharacterized protein V6R79_016802 [Siganus canaliculatus]
MKSTYTEVFTCNGRSQRRVCTPRLRLLRLHRIRTFNVDACGHVTSRVSTLEETT